MMVYVRPVKETYIVIGNRFPLALSDGFAAQLLDIQDGDTFKMQNHTYHVSEVKDKDGCRYIYAAINKEEL